MQGSRRQQLLRTPETLWLGSQTTPRPGTVQGRQDMLGIGGAAAVLVLDESFDDPSVCDAHAP